MTTTQIVLVVALVAVLAILLIARGSGPSVTHIETRKDQDSGDR
ncbi:hypothetical protein [Sphingomonas sp. HDW15A]|nr:hypothetical protein [Sphingomonas sp. HDW15A]